MKRLLIAAFLILRFPVFSFAWNEPEDFRGMKWGSSPSEAEHVCSNPWEVMGLTDERSKTYSCEATIGKAPVTLTLKFLDNKFAGVDIAFKSEDFLLVKMAFEEKYGPPQSEHDLPNAQYIEKRWTGKKVIIKLSVFGKYGLASIHTTDLIDYLAMREKQKGKSAAKDL